MKRLKYVDAARGLAIFTVVYSHICLFCLPGYASSAVIDFLRSYFLNAFFFISGYMAYKGAISSVTEITVEIWKKIRQLLIPTFIVGSAYAISHDIAILDFLFDSAKYGYWFTFVLFMMFTIYYMVAFASSVAKGYHRIAQVVLLLMLSAILYSLHKGQILCDPMIDLLCFGNLSFYFVYFAAGIIASQYRGLISWIMHVGGGVIVLLSFILVVISYIIWIPLIIRNFMILGLVIYILGKTFSDDAHPIFVAPIKNCFSILGQYTLEIYFLHYFMLFKLPSCLGAYLSELSYGNQSLSFPEFMIIGSLALVVCLSCMVLSYLLQRISYVSLLMFGKLKKYGA